MEPVSRQQLHGLYHGHIYEGAAVMWFGAERHP